MNRPRQYLTILGAIVIAVAMVWSPALGQSPQIGQTPATSRARAENVKVEPGTGGVVQFLYDLVADGSPAVFGVAVEVSLNGGRTFAVTPRALTGDVGAGLAAGPGKRIVWDAAKDVERVEPDLLRVRISVHGPPVGRASIRSTPEGAAVTVDGVQRGMTPLDLQDLTPGEHRITLVRSGFLEHSRLVAIDPARPEVLDVTLTAVPVESPTAAETTTKQVPASGSGKAKKILLPVIAAGVVGGVLAARGGGNDGGVTPTPPPAPAPQANRPPTVGSITHDLIGTAISNTTVVRATVTGLSDPDGDALTCQWFVSDSRRAPPVPCTTTSSNSPLVFFGNGPNTSSVTVRDSRGGEVTRESAPFTVGELNGRWLSDRTGFNDLCDNSQFEFTQSNQSIQGGVRLNLHLAGNNVIHSLGGSLSHPRQVVLTLAQGAIFSGSGSGTVNDNLTVISGTTRLSPTTTVVCTLRRQ